MAHFVNHEPCPKCGSRDNVARYSDGSAWCFGCGYKERATHYSPKVEKTLYLPELTKPLPEENQKWLEQWLTKEETSVFWYAPKMRRHIYIIYDDDVPVFFEARSIKDKPKTLCYGEKPLHILNADSDTIVFVEDIISAIKVSRHCAAVPLFGSHLNKEWAIYGSKYKQQFLWLDYDKWAESVRIGRTLSVYSSRLTSIQTKEDPKACTDQEILTQLKML